MAINFPNSPSNGATATLAGKTYTYDSSKSKWSPSGGITLSALSVGSEATASGDGGIAYNSGSGVFTFTPAVAAGTGVTVHATQSAMVSADASSAVTEGSLHYDTGANKLYVKMGDASSTGFYLLASITNASPTISSPSTGTSFELDGAPNPTTISIAASDSDAGQALNYYYTVSTGTIASGTTVTTSATSGGTYASNGNAVAGSSNASTNSHFRINPSNSVATSFSLTFYVTDGTNIANTICSFTLVFKIENSRYTSLLISANAAAVNNNNITDSSSDAPANNTAHSLTIGGNTTAGSFSPYRNGGYSLHFKNGSTAAIMADGSSDFAFGTGSGTIECWYKQDADTSSDDVIWDFRPSGSNASNTPQLQLASNDVLQFLRWGTGNYTKASSISLTPDTWNHLVIEKVNSNVYFWVNGQSAISSWTDTSSWEVGANRPVIGNAGYNFNYPARGMIRDFRIVKGSAAYGGNAPAVPTEPLTAVTNTKLLACALPYIADANTQVARKILAVNGGVETTTVGPYDIEDEASVADGNSIYFDGSGDYIAVANSADMTLNTDWCIECWYYNESSAVGGIWYQYGSSAENQVHYFNTRNAPNVNGLELGTSNSTGNTSVQALGVIPNSQMNLLRTWTHVSLTKEGTTLRYFFNGILQNTVTKTGNAKTPTDPFVIGATTSTGGGPMTGYIADFRLVKGSAVRTASFIPPTSPIALHSDTKIAVTGKNASVFDKSQNGNGIYFDGSATISSTNARSAFPYYLKLPNTNLNDRNFVSVAPSSVFNIGTGDFTIEAFIWTDTVGASEERYVFDFTSAAVFIVAGRLKYYNTSTGTSSTLFSTGFGLLSTGAWHYIAASRVSGTTRLYANGTLTASATDAKDFDSLHTTALKIGAYRNGGYNWNGNISDFRITKGLARYTGSSHTVPTAPLKG